jgi:hypothetical protein
MALWYADPTPLKTTFRRNDMMSDAYLYLPGPSLSLIDFDVRVEGTMAFGVNTSYPRVKPNMWIGMDKPECYDARLLWEAFPKIFRGSYYKLMNHSRPLKDYPQTYFADVQKPEKGIRDMFLLKKDQIYFSWFKHTLGVALHVILWMGAKKIHFVGCDLGGNKDYYDDRVLTDTQRKYNRELYSQQKVFLKEFSVIAKEFNIECISCTDNSPINEFMPYIDIKIALDISKRKAGEIKPVKHALETQVDTNTSQAEKIAWKKPIRERGVLVMCDKDQEWILPWWVDNYLKYNHIPIQFVDIGMSEEGAKFCKARGSYTKMPELELKNWFKKPFAMKLTLFKRTLYMDLDCEVRGSIFEFFENLSGFVISNDVPNNFSTVSNPVNSGVVCYDWGEQIITRWANKVLSSHVVMRGDQDCLDHIEKIYTPLPKEYHWLRIMGENATSIIYHYTGSTGKKIIRENLIGN